MRKRNFIALIAIKSDAKIIKKIKDHPTFAINYAKLLNLEDKLLDTWGFL